MRVIPIVVLLAVLLAVSGCAPTSFGDDRQRAEPPLERPVVLVLADGLSWDAVEREPALADAFHAGAAASLSTSQGAAPDDPRVGYLYLGAGSRVDTAVLPATLPRDARSLPGAFTGPASTVQPGLLGETLRETGVETAAAGRSPDRAALVLLDTGGRLPPIYPENPVEGLEAALRDGADFVAVGAGGPEEAGEVIRAARALRTTVAVAAPNVRAAAGESPLTPFVVLGEQGVLYSPNTRTKGLISNTDVAPTLLAELGVDPPPGIQGRDAEVRPGSVAGVEQLASRLDFVAEKRAEVWIAVGIAGVLGLLASTLWKGRRGLHAALFALPGVPAGILLAAIPPVTNVPLVAALILVCAGALATLSLKLSRTPSGALAGIFLSTAVLVAADAAAGGFFMRFSILGYNPAYGARFYGIGNEYSAILAGAFVTGVGILAQSLSYRRRSFHWILAVAAGIAVILALGLPGMGADVGGSLALGFGFGASVGLLRGDRLPGVVLWATAGLLFAAALFVGSGILAPEASHGARAASGGSGLGEIIVRKLLLSLGHLSNPLFIVLLAITGTLTYAGWRRARGTPLAAGMLGAGVTALASGALNDSGIVSTILVLAYPAVAAVLGVLLVRDVKNRRVR